MLLRISRPSRDSWSLVISFLLTCMKLAGVEVWLLIDFNVTKLKDGIQRVFV